MIRPGDKIPPPEGLSPSGGIIRLSEEHLPPGGLVIVVSPNVKSLKPFASLSSEFASLGVMLIGVIPGVPPKASKRAVLDIAGRITLIYDPAASYISSLGLAKKGLLGFLKVALATIISSRALTVIEVLSGGRAEHQALEALSILRRLSHKTL